jgi:PAS domain S-box-containing protein
MQKAIAVVRRFRPKGVRLQLILGITVVHLIMMSLFMADLVRRQSAFLRKQSQEQALGLANDLAVNSRAHVTGDDLDGLERLVQTYKQFPHLEYAMVLSPDNIVLAHTDPADQGKSAVDGVSLRIGKEVRSHILVSDNHVLDVAVPLLQDGALIGWVRVGMEQDYIDANLTTMIWKGIVYLIVVVILGILVALFIVNRVTAGLYRLIDAAEKIRGGDRSQRASLTGSVEITRLGIAFNEMLDNILESEEKFRSLVEQSQIGVYIIQDRKLVYVNPVFAAITGYSREELLGQVPHDFLVHEEDIAMTQRKLEQRIRGEKPTDRFLLRVMRRDGAIVWLEAMVSTIVYHNGLAAIGSVIDITDRLHEENRINKAVIAAQESERMQIGMELHDNVQQIMVGSLLGIDYVKSNLDDKLRATETLSSIKGYIKESIEELRRLSHQLAPSMGSGEKLKDKVQDLVENMNRGGRLDVEIVVEQANGQIDEELQLAFYRILQEQFNNILKYAEASHVTIGIKQADHYVELSIRDDGVGFDPATTKQGIGMENIRRRAAAMEGDLKILSGAGEGCELLLRVPV